MGHQKIRPCGEQPQGQDQVSGAPLDASHRVGDLRVDGNSPAHDVLGSAYDRLSHVVNRQRHHITISDACKANEMLGALANLIVDLEDLKSAKYCCVNDAIDIEVTDAIRASAMEATNIRIWEIKTRLRELGVDVDHVGGGQ